MNGSGLDRNRSALLAAARRVFTRAGFEAATPQAIAAEAGVDEAVVRERYPGRDILLLDCFHEDLQAHLRESLRVLDDEAPILDQLMDVAGMRLSWAAQNPAFARIVFQRVPFLPDPEARRHPAHLDSVLEKVVELIEAAQFRGEVRDGIDVVLLVRCLLGSYVLALREGLAKPRPDGEEMCTQLRAMLDLQLDAVRITRQSG